jgi:hypothetical protein
MSRPPQEQEGSGTLLDMVRDVGRGLGALSAVSGLLGILSIALGLILLVAVSETKVFGYALLGLGFILLAMGLVIARRTVAETVTSRRGRYGATTLTMAAAFLALVAILNFVAFDNPLRTDVTSTKQFTLAPRTLDILENLSEPVKAIAFFDREDLDQEVSFNMVDNMLHEFDVRSDKFSYEVVDPAVEPVTARDYGVINYGQVAFVGEESGNFGVAFGSFKLGSDPVAGTTQYAFNPFIEQDFVTPLLVVTGAEKKSVYFLVGHGERDLTSNTDDTGYFIAAARLQGENYDIKVLDLQTQELVPKADENLEEGKVSPTVILVAGPNKDLLPDEADALKGYLRSGGRLMLLLEPDAPDTFRTFLSQWGIVLGEGVIVDQDDAAGPDPRVPFITRYNPNFPMTSVLGRTYFPGVTSVGRVTENLPFVEVGGQRVTLSVVPMTQDGTSSAVIFPVPGGPVALLETHDLTRTSDGSWLVMDQDRSEPDEDVDTQGPFSTAILVNAPLGVALGDELPASPEDINDASLLVFGDSDFASNVNFNSASNGDLFLNSVNHLAGDVALINIRPKAQARRELLATPNEFDVIRYSSWFLLPALMGMAGVFTWWRRR